MSQTIAPVYDPAMAHSLRNLSLALMLLAAASLHAQKRPDFSGTWVTVSPADGAGQEQVVTQTAATLSVSHGSEGGHHAMTYKLDGSESRNELTSHGDKILTVSRATWKGEQLTITSSTTYPDGGKLDQVAIWSFDGKGQLVIDVTETMTGRPAETFKVVSRKKS
jgi:hypothetical protein